MGGASSGANHSGPGRGREGRLIYGLTHGGRSVVYLPTSHVERIVGVPTIHGSSLRIPINI